MSSVHLAIAVAACFVACSRVGADDGKLQRVRDEVNAPTAADNSGRSTGEDGESDFLNDLCNFLFNDLLVGVPHVLLNDDWETMRHFLPYPYFGRQPGHLMMPDSERVSREEYSRLRPWAGRVDVEGSSDFRGLDRINGHVLLDTNSRLGLQGSWTYLSERVCRNRRDDMSIADLNVVVRYAQNDTAEVRVGCGGRIGTDSTMTRGGFNATWGADWFPAKPLVVSTAVDVGTLGSAFLFHVRATAGVMVRQWEFFAGYDYQIVGSVDLQGPVAGIRLWF